MYQGNIVLYNIDTTHLYKTSIYNVYINFTMYKIY